MIAEHYDALWGPERPRLVSEFLHDVFQRHKPVQSVLDMACGTFSIDLELFQWGYDIVGCDVSPEMLEPDGTRIAIFKFNEQNAAKTQHMARFLTVIQRNDVLEVGLDEAVLRVWRKEDLAKAPADHGFRPVEWWGDLEKGVHYDTSEAHRLVCVAVRR